MKNIYVFRFSRKSNYFHELSFHFACRSVFYYTFHQINELKMCSANLFWWRKKSYSNATFWNISKKQVKCVWFFSSPNDFMQIHCPFLVDCNLIKVKATSDMPRMSHKNMPERVKSACLKPGTVMCKLALSIWILISQNKTEEDLSYNVVTALQCRISAHSIVLWRILWVQKVSFVKKLPKKICPY